MQVHRHRAVGRESVAAIGNFDGMHRGHAALLERVRTLAARRRLAATAVLFEPQPDELLRPGAAPARLMRLTEKLRRLREAGIDHAYCLRFDPLLARMSARDFIRRVLQERVGARILVSGRDFRFGHRREGDAALLREYDGLELVCMPDLRCAGRRISSSAIRAALATGRLDEARELLGRPYSLRGRVVPGAGRGRRLGFATANLRAQRPPLEGVYVSRIRLAHASLPSISYLGSRPVFHGTGPVLETHVLDFDGELYGQHIEVEFLRRLRVEGHFHDSDALRRQVRRDIEAARQYHHPHRRAHG